MPSGAHFTPPPTTRLPSFAASLAISHPHPTIQSAALKCPALLYLHTACLAAEGPSRPSPNRYTPFAVE